MGRDFTPKEKVMANAKFKDLYLQNIVRECTNGKRIPMFSEEEQNLRLKYPTLAVTSTRILLDLHKDLPREISETIISRVENLIKNIIVMDSLNDFRACPKEAKDWYLGQLDAHFHYSEVNDKLFYDWIINHFYKQR